MLPDNRAMYGGHANVDELRTAYERLQERYAYLLDEIEWLREDLLTKIEQMTARVNPDKEDDDAA